MADDKINKDNVAQAKEYLRTLIEAKDISRDITDFTKQLLKNYEGSSAQISSILSTYRDISKAINDQSSNILQVLDAEKSTKDIVKDILKNKNLSRKLESEELSLRNQQNALLEEQIRLEKQASIAAEQENMQLFDSYIKEGAALSDKLSLNQQILKTIQAQNAELDYTIKANNIAKDISEKADKKTKNISALTNIIKSIPGLKEFAKPFEEAEKAARKAALASKSASDIFKEGAKAFLGAVDFRKLGAALGTQYIKTAVTADERTTCIAKNLSLGKEAADGVYSNLKNFKGTLDSSLQSTQKLVDAFNDLSELSDFSFIATKNQVDAQILLTKEIGVSKEAALGYQSAVAVSNIDAKKGLDIVYDQIAAFANQNGIVADGRKIFDQINKTSKLIQLNFRGNFDSLVKTTLQANKLGLSLDQVSKVGESLLNFEQSISSELEAELLTGRDLNLEKARLFALNHDIAGLTQEIANQNITAESFAAMNVIQQEAIAKALGMQASELGEALYNQKLIEQTAGNFTKDLRAQAAEARKINNLALEKKLLLQAEGIEKGIISGKDLESAQRSLDIQDKFNNALEQAQEIFSDFVNGGALERLVNLLTAFVKSVQTKGLGATLIGGIDKAAQQEVDLAQINNKTQNISVASISKKSESEQNADIEALQEKRRILLGQIEETTLSDKVSNRVDELFGLVNNSIYKDNLKVEQQSTQAQKQLPEVEKLLRELNETVKQGGNINMEARQVGTTTAINTYRM